MSSRSVVRLTRNVLAIGRSGLKSTPFGGDCPDYLMYMLRGEPWSPFNLAALLGCTTSEAEEALALFGYELVRVTTPGGTLVEIRRSVSPPKMCPHKRWFASTRS